MGKLNKFIFVWLVITLNIVVSVIGFLQVQYSPETAPFMPFLGCFNGILGLGIFAITVILVYKMWKILQGNEGSFSPGLAIGLMFIPLFNMIWHFFIYVRWARDYNRLCDERKLMIPRAPTSLLLLYCIWIVFGGILGGVLGVMIGLRGETLDVLSLPSILLLVQSVIGIVFVAYINNLLCDHVNTLIDLGITPQPPQLEEGQEVRTSKLAVTSFVLSLLGPVTFLLSLIPALVMGIVGIVNISGSRGRQKGLGFAVAGVSISGVSLFAIPMLMAILLPALGRVKVLAQRLVRGTDGKSITFAMIDHDAQTGALPTCDEWREVAMSYMESGMEPKTLTGEKFGIEYALNSNLAGTSLADVSDPALVLIFEVPAEFPDCGGKELLEQYLLADPSLDGINVGFTDGNAEFIRTENLDSLNWEPKPKSAI